jgi:hypothetical protein
LESQKDPRTLHLSDSDIGIGQGKRSASIWQVAACVIVAELVMVGVAALLGKRPDQWGRKPIFLCAFAVLAHATSSPSLATTSGTSLLFNPWTEWQARFMAY